MKYFIGAIIILLSLVSINAYAQRTNDQKLMLSQMFYDIKEYSYLYENLKFYSDNNSNEFITDNIYLNGENNKVKVIVFRNGGLGNIEIGKTLYKYVLDYLGMPDIIEKEGVKIIYINNNEYLSFCFDGEVLKFIIYNSL